MHQIEVENNPCWLVQVSFLYDNLFLELIGWSVFYLTDCTYIKMSTKTAFILNQNDRLGWLLNLFKTLIWITSTVSAGSVHKYSFCIHLKVLNCRYYSTEWRLRLLIVDFGITFMSTDQSFQWNRSLNLLKFRIFKWQMRLTIEDCWYFRISVIKIMFHTNLSINVGFYSDLKFLKNWCC